MVTVDWQRVSMASHETTSTIVRRPDTREASDRIAETREIEVTYLQRRHDDRAAGASTLTGADTHRATHRLDVVQHENRRFVVPEVLDGAGDLSLLDEEGPVSRQASVQDGARVDRANVPEPRDEDSAIGRRNHLFQRALSARH